jgi:hypothetical protein
MTKETVLKAAIVIALFAIGIGVGALICHKPCPACPAVTAPTPPSATAAPTAAAPAAAPTAAAKK